MNMGLSGKIAVVTGGASGIGEATVRTFAEEGAIPVIVDRNTERGERVAGEIEAAGHTVFFIAADLTRAAECQAAVSRTLEAHGKVDILINNAGVNDGVGFGASAEQFMDSLKLNLVHYFLMAKYALDSIKQNHGVIINISSKVAMTGQKNTSAYVAAKGGILALTREWAAELAEFDVRVNCVVPADCWTPLYEWFLEEFFDDPEAKKKEITNLIPLGRRMTTPQEMANTIVFLASPRSSHTTGQQIVVDGGYIHLDRAL